MLLGTSISRDQMCQAMSMPESNLAPLKKCAAMGSAAPPQKRPEPLPFLRRLTAGLTVILGFRFPPASNPRSVFVLATVLLAILLLSCMQLPGLASELTLVLAEDMSMFTLLFSLWALASQYRSKPEDVTSLRIPNAAEPSSPKGTRFRKAHRRDMLRQASDDLRVVVLSLHASGKEPSNTSVYWPQRTHSLHNYHMAIRSNVQCLVPAEVAACQYPADVSEHVQRLLEDRWAMRVGVTAALLTPIIEAE